jgi:glycine/D-amino acid oxidase-like deaminating enzyme
MTTNDIYDAVVVGAGLSGALVAHHLAEASLNVIVLEAMEAPGGIAGRGTGLALLGTPEPYSALQERLGADAGRHIWALTHRNLDLLAAILEKVNQESTRVGSLRVAKGQAHIECLRQSVFLLKQDLYNADVDESNEDQIGVRTTDDLAFDPEALIDALLDHPNITIEYQTEVQSIRPHASVQSENTPILAVWARKRSIWAKKVVVTGGAHAVRLNQHLGKIVKPLAMHAIDVRNDAALPVPLVLKNGQGIAQALDGYWRIVGWTEGAQDVLSLLTEVTGDLCPDANVSARHSWWVGQSQDGLPVVGQLPGIPGAYTISGLGPWGMSWVFVAADLLVSMMIHQEEGGALSIDRLLNK